MQTSINDSLDMQSKYSHVSFRELIKLRTSYATHNLYPYPAKFIPNIVRYFIEKYTKPGETVFDPFAGSGTVAIEAEITGRNYVLWDLNPIMEILVKAETWRGEIPEKIFEIDFNYGKSFLPKWDNVNYWHPKEFTDQLSKLWAFYHDHPNPLLAIPLFKVTKYFSYAELEFPKLYKSKVAIERINKLLNSDWREAMKDLYWKEVERVIKKVKEFQSLCKCASGKVISGIDVINEDPPKVDAIITSPPYLQAQEYIRTFKMELYWLGYDDAKIKELSKKEIPYNNSPDVEIRSNIFREYLEKIRKFNNDNLIKIYTTYFKSIIYFFSKVDARTLGIFAGPVKVRTLRIPIDEILREHLESLGWKHEATFIDKIMTRRMKNVDKNPATGLDDERTPTEHLLIMTRPF